MAKIAGLCAAACLLASPLAQAQGQGESTLCNADETVVFSCHMAKKTVSLCHSASAAHALSYRFGTPGHPELTYPDAQKHEAARFASSESPLYGGGAQTVTFRRGDYEYGLYSQVSRSDDGQGNGADGGDRTPEFEDGLVVSRGGKPLKKMVCDDGGQGFREDVDWIKAK
jgi:hypothetical protein